MQRHQKTWGDRNISELKGNDRQCTNQSTSLMWQTIRRMSRMRNCHKLVEQRHSRKNLPMTSPFSPRPSRNASDMPNIYNLCVASEVHCIPYTSSSTQIESSAYLAISSPDESKILPGSHNEWISFALRNVQLGGYASSGHDQLHFEEETVCALDILKGDAAGIYLKNEK